ncbi:MAG TPA: SpoIIE family protein phosphatase [Candidatus Eisenbacteria bacterium]|jgi:serine phosphatase RsbU (regulator of sigma subunit)
MHQGWSGSLPAWLLVPAAAVLALSALSLPRQPYTGLMLQSDRVAGVVPGSPGDRAGLLPGDRLRPVPPSRTGPAARLGPLAGASPGVPLPLERRADGGEWRRVWLVPEPLPDGERRMMAAELAVCAGFVLLAGVVWSERRDRLTRTFLRLCLAFAWLVMPTPLWPSAWAGAAWQVVYSGITLFLPALFIQFFALFPEGGARGGRVTALVRVGYVVAALLFAASLLEVAWPPDSPRVTRALEILQGAAAVWFGAGLALALALFAGSYLRARSPDARRRLRVALAGTLLGAGPLAALILFRNLAPGIPLPGERWAVVLTLLVPASFAWAVVAHRIFDFHVALRAASVGLGLAGVGGVAWLGGEWIARHWGTRLGAEVEGLSLAGIAVLAAVLGPVGTWMRGLNARFERDAGAASLGAWAVREDSAGSDAEERILRAACRALHEALRLDGCSALALERGAVRAVASTGGAAPGALDPGLLGLLDGGGAVAVDDARLLGTAAALERSGVRWVLPVGRAPARALLLLGTRLSGAWLGRIEARELERFAEHVDVALENAELRRAARTQGELEREMQVAHAMQVHLLPRRAPVYPTLDCAAAAMSSESVGGDYYDFVETSARDFTLAVGDAAGKGVPAALVLAGVQARFRDEARRVSSPGTLLAALNRELVGLDQPEKFMGLLCARVEVRPGRVWFANAGLTPPLVRRRNGRFEELTAGGVLLGVSGEATYPDVCVELAAGDVVVLYTDGLTEARRGDELFGTDRVRRSLDACGTRRAADILECLLSEVRAFADCALDDLTVVVLRQITEPQRGRTPPSQIALKLRAAAADASM